MFAFTNTILFDGESALRSVKAKKKIKEKLGIVLHSDPFFKRNLAERGIREFKTRLSIHLQMEGKNSKLNHRN